MKKIKPGSLVRVVFVDHCMSADTPEMGVTFEVVGRYTHEKDGVFAIRVWGAPDDLSYDQNSNSFSIVASTIKKIEILRPIRASSK